MYDDRLIQAGFAYLYVGLYDEALASFVRAIEANPSRPEPYFHASITAHRNGDLANASRWAMRAMELAPDRAEYVENWRVITASQLVEESQSTFFSRGYQGRVEAAPSSVGPRSAASGCAQAA